jgi:hypothetical protein
MIDFTLAELLTGLDMSDRETDQDFRVRITAAAADHHDKHQRAAFGGASLADLSILISEAYGHHLDEVGKHYGVTRSETSEAEKPKRENT